MENQAKPKQLERVASDDAGDKGSISSFEKISLHSEQGSGRASPSEEPSTGETTAPKSAKPEPSSGSQKLSEQPQKEMNTLDPVVRELGEAAAVAAAVTKEAATAASQTLKSGVAEARAFMSSFWSVFEEPNVSSSEPQQSDSELRSRLGLDDDEVILETFRCKLLQAYRPSTNDFTPAKTIGFSGQLHIAGNHVCFELDGSGDASPPASIPKKNIVSFKREEDAVEILLKGGKSLVLGHFSLPNLEVESVIALLEMLTSLPTDVKRVPDGR